jgi:MarR family transcriptional regulator, organic hydroperoxide resistance regulator
LSAYPLCGAALLCCGAFAQPGNVDDGAAQFRFGYLLEPLLEQITVESGVELQRQVLAEQEGLGGIGVTRNFACCGRNGPAVRMPLIPGAFRDEVAIIGVDVIPADLGLRAGLDLSAVDEMGCGDRVRCDQRHSGTHMAEDRSVPIGRVEFVVWPRRRNAGLVAPSGAVVDSEGDKSMAELLAERQVAGMALDLDAMATVSNIYRVSTRIRNHIEQGVLREWELTWTSFVTLWVLWIWGETQTRYLAEEVGVSRSTLSGVLNTLERRGLVQRRPHETEGRLVLVSNTEAGDALMADLFPKFNAEESFIVEPLSTDTLHRLASALRSVARHLDAAGQARHEQLAGEA